MNDSNIKMVSSVKAVLLSVALLAANAAWSQTYAPYAASKNWNRSDAVPISKATFRDALVTGFRMAIASEIVWPRYAYEINFSSDNLVGTCQLLEQIEQDAVVLTSEFDLDAQNSSGEVKGYELEPSRVCEFKNKRSSEIVWPEYAYKINLNSDNLVGICQFLEQIEQNAAVSTSEFKLYAQNSSGAAKSEELELWRVCNSDSSAEAQGIYNDFLEETSNYDSHYLVTETRVRSLELGTQTLEFDTLIWPDNAEEPGIYNYFLREASDYDNYYLVTESPVPHLDLNTRVWLGDTTSYSSVMLN